MEHKNKHNVDDDEKIIDGKIIDGKKIWIDTELKSSILFEVPKENQKDTKDSYATIAPSNTLKNNEIKTTEITEEEDVDRSRD